MESVRIYLRTPLYAARKSSHVPQGAVVLEGKVEEQAHGGMVVAVHVWLDDQGRALEGAAKRLFLPLAKIDHVELLDGDAA